MPAPKDETSKLQKPSGRVRHDAGGRAIWEWALDSGRHAIDSTSLLLKKLDLTSLSLLGDDTKKKWEKDSQESAPNGDALEPEKSQPAFRSRPDQPEPKALNTAGLRIKEPHVGGGGSFDPYNSRTPTGRGVAPVNAKAQSKPRVTQPLKPSRKPGFFARLFGR